MAATASCFARRETRLTCRDMVSGFLMELEDYNCWTIAEAAGHPGPHRMQHLLSRARFDDRQMLDTAAAWAASQLTVIRASLPALRALPVTSWRFRISAGSRNGQASALNGNGKAPHSRAACP